MFRKENKAVFLEMIFFNDSGFHFVFENIYPLELLNLK